MTKTTLDWEKEFDNKFHWRMAREMKLCICEKIKDFIRQTLASELKAEKKRWREKEIDMVLDNMEIIDKEYQRALKENLDEANGYAHSYAIEKILFNELNEKLTKLEEE